MSEPRQHIFHAVDFRTFRQLRAVDHQDRQAQSARRVDFCARTATARILRDNQINAMLFQQSAVAGLVEGPFCDDDVMVRQGRCSLRWIDKAQKVVMLRMFCEATDVLAPDGQEDALRFGVKRGDGAGHVRGGDPDIRVDLDPRRTRERNQRQPGFSAGQNGISTHDFRERMRCINDMGDCVLTQVGGQALGATETTDARRNRQRLRQSCAPSIGIDGIKSGFADRMRKSAGFGCTAKYQKGGASGHG